MMIDGVKVTPRKVLPDERGRLTEIFRNDEPDFEKFGQVYATTAYPGVVKAWHYHKKQTDNFFCVYGMMKVVLYDAREGSPTRGEVNVFYLGDHNPIRLRIPVNVYHGFMCVSDREAMVINVPTEVYNYKEPDEFRVPPHDKSIPYDWTRKDG
jgi:dTDP-4-dehydrorhamnose 3,5-epimerase